MGVMEGRVQNNEVSVYTLQMRFRVYKTHVAELFYQTHKTNDSVAKTT